MKGDKKKPKHTKFDATRPEYKHRKTKRGPGRFQKKYENWLSEFDGRNLGAPNETTVSN